MTHHILSRCETSPFASPSDLPGIEYAWKSLFVLAALGWAYSVYYDFQAAYRLRTPTGCLCSRHAILLPVVNPTETNLEKLTASPLEKAPLLTLKEPIGQ